VSTKLFTLADVGTALIAVEPPLTTEQVRVLRAGLERIAQGLPLEDPVLPAGRGGVCPNCENNSGYVRHVGRDNDEVVEDCPDHKPEQSPPTTLECDHKKSARCVVPDGCVMVRALRAGLCEGCGFPANEGDHVVCGSKP